MGLSAGARRVGIGVVAYLIATWIAVVAVDGANLWGLRDALEEGPVSPPALWQQLYAEGQVTEWLQWGCLAALALTAARLSGWLGRGGDHAAARCWMVFALLGALLLLEDAGNLRHTIARFAGWATQHPVAAFLSETMLFYVLAAVAFFPWVAYRGELLRWRVPMGFLVGGYVAYATAGLMSATRGIGLWYERAGQWLGDRLMPDGLVLLGLEHGYATDDATAFYLMDSLVEESIELIAATLLLMAALTYATRHREAVQGPPAADEAESRPEGPLSNSPSQDDRA